MRKSAVTEIFARRLGVTPSRVDAIAQRLADAGKLSRAEGSRRYPPDLAGPEITSLFIAVIADNGLGNVRETVELFSSLSNEKGQRLDNALAVLLFGPPQNIQHLIARQTPSGLSMIVEGSHLQFGAAPTEDGATAARIVPGNNIMSIAAELQGATPAQADAMTAITRLSNGYR